jgi:predicted MFS family arabinose efflux permease
MLNTSVERTGKINAYLWLMFGICFLGNILGGSISTIMSVYLPEVVENLLGTAEEKQLNKVSAYLNALYFTGWAIGGLLCGVISDRIGRARSLSMTIIMFGLFTLLISVTSSWEMVVIYRFLSGFAVGGMLVINTTLLSEVWPASSKAIFIGILSTGFPVGIFSSGVIHYLIAEWRQGFMIGALPLSIGIISFWILKESEKWQFSRSVRERTGNWEKIRNNRMNLVNGSVVFGCMLIGLWAIFSWTPTWIQSLLEDKNGQHERGLGMMMLGIGGLTGGFFSGWISNLLGTRRAMLVCFIGCFILSIILFKFNTVFTVVTLIEITLLSVLFGVSQGLLSVYIPLLFPIPVRASATGFCFNIGRFVTAAAVFFVGTLVVVLGGYGNSLFAFSFVFLIGFLILLVSNNNKPLNIWHT